MNQRPLRPERSGDELQGVSLQEFKEMLLAACTKACTSEPEIVRAELLRRLDEGLAKLRLDGDLSGITDGGDRELVLGEVYHGGAE